MKDSVLGLMYVAEQCSFNTDIKNLKVEDNSSIVHAEFDATLQSFDCMNRNNRRYILDNVRKCLETSEKIQTWLKNDSWFGEMNHPTSKYKDLKLSRERLCDPEMERTSHKITNPVFTSNLLNARIKTDPSNEAGRNMTIKIIKGLVPSFSCRAIATLQMIDNLPTVIVNKLITYDWVLFPSHKEAEQISPTKYKADGYVTESDNTYVDECVYLKDILEYAGEKNVNAKLIMESFELDNSSLIGITKNAKSLIIKDNDNIIYCGIDTNMRKNINGYLNNITKGRW